MRRLALCALVALALPGCALLREVIGNAPTRGDAVVSWARSVCQLPAAERSSVLTDINTAAQPATLEVSCP